MPLRLALGAELAGRTVLGSPCVVPLGDGAAIVVPVIRLPWIDAGAVLIAIDSRSGKTRWQTRLGMMVYATPVVVVTAAADGSTAADLLVFGTHRNAARRAVWQPDPLKSSDVVALYADSGQRAWSLRARNRAQQLPDLNFGTVTAVDHRILVHCSGGYDDSERDLQGFIIIIIILAGGA